jgi:hypothetical protein
MLQPLLATLAQCSSPARVQPLLSLLLQPVQAAIKLGAQLLSVALSRMGLPGAATHVAIAAGELQGWLKAAQLKLPPGAAGVLILVVLLGGLSALLKEHLMKAIVWLIA